MNAWDYLNYALSKPNRLYLRLHGRSARRVHFMYVIGFGARWPLADDDFNWAYTTRAQAAQAANGKQP